MQSEFMRDAIAALGSTLGPDVLATTIGLFEGEQKALVAQQPVSDCDISYGPHERHTLDIYQPALAAEDLSPVLVFVHGGGFLKGDKGSDTHWHNSNVGRMAARAGYVGVVINYRLAPENTWPSGGEDVAAVVAWLKDNAAQYAGDADNIVLMGTSAGAVHLSTYLKLNSDTDHVRGLVLLSGLYGFTSMDERDTAYYGEHSLYSERAPLDAVVNTALPLLVVCSEFDPPRFQQEFVGLLQERLALHNKLPKALIVSGHNHYSLAMHLGTSDTRLADEIFSFVKKIV